MSVSNLPDRNIPCPDQITLALKSILSHGSSVYITKWQNINIQNSSTTAGSY